MADSDHPTERALKAWLTPREARAIAMASLGDVEFKSGQSLWEAVAGGLIAVAAGSTAMRSGRTGVPYQREAPYLIPKKYWDSYYRHGDSDFWNGRAHFLVPSEEYGAAATLYRAFRLKLDPAAVKREFPLEAKSESPPEDSKRKPNTGLPVPGAALEAWSKAYKLTYTGAADKLETAYASAAGAFPGRSYSREQIRNLVGGNRTRGPKGPRQP